MVKREKRKINLQPTLTEQSERRFDGDLHLRGSIVKGNLGTFYTQLYADLFGGIVAPRYKGNHDELLSGELRNKCPDIVRETATTITDIEIKATSSRDRRPEFTKEQIENYFDSFCQRLMQTEGKTPDFELGIFRYGQENKYVHLNYYSTKDFVRILSKSTKSLMILPSNLAFFSFICARHKIHDRAATKSETKCIDYHRYSRRFFNSLSETKDPVDFLLSLTLEEGETETPEYLQKLDLKTRADLILNKLHLHKLKVERFSSEDVADLGCRRFRFIPFKVTKFYMPEKSRQSWLAEYSKSHQYLLEELVGVRDLYEENNRLPF